MQQKIKELEIKIDMIESKIFELNDHIVLILKEFRTLIYHLDIHNSMIFDNRILSEELWEKVHNKKIIPIPSHDWAFEKERWEKLLKITSDYLEDMEKSIDERNKEESNRWLNRSLRKKDMTEECIIKERFKKFIDKDTFEDLIFYLIDKEIIKEDFIRYIKNREAKSQLHPLPPPYFPDEVI